MMELAVSQKVQAEEKELREKGHRVGIRYLACFLVAIMPMFVRGIHGQSVLCTSASLPAAGPYHDICPSFIAISHIIVVVFCTRMMICEMMQSKRALNARVHRLQFFNKMLHPAMLRDRTRKSATKQTKKVGRANSTVGGSSVRLSATGTAAGAGDRLSEEMDSYDYEGDPSSDRGRRSRGDGRSRTAGAISPPNGATHERGGGAKYRRRRRRRRRRPASIL